MLSVSKVKEETTKIDKLISSGPRLSSSKGTVPANNLCLRYSSRTISETAGSAKAAYFRLTLRVLQHAFFTFRVHTLTLTNSRPQDTKHISVCAVKPTETLASLCTTLHISPRFALRL